jgi:quercetin dioxygenase-like cupin family protein
MTQHVEHFQIHHDEMEPAPVRAEDGWKRMDIRFLINKDNAGSRHACFWRTVFPPGAAHERHTHPNAAEILYVVRGRGAAGTETEEHEAPAGTAIYVPPGAVHWFRNLDPDNETEIVGCYAPGGSLDDAGYEYIGEITAEYRTV